MGKLRWIVVVLVLGVGIAETGTAQSLEKKAIAAEISHYLDRAANYPDSGFVEKAWKLSEAWKEQVVAAKGKPGSQLVEATSSGIELPASSIVLEWFVADSQLYLFSSSQYEVFGHRMGPETEWAELLDAFYAACLPAADTVGSEVVFTQIASRVYQELLKPVLPVPQMVRNPILAALADNNLPRLILIPDETLTAIPFDLALTQAHSIQGGGYLTMPYLFRSYDIRYQSLLTPSKSDTIPWIRHRWNSASNADFHERYRDRLVLGMASGKTLRQARENWLEAGKSIHPAHWGAMALWEQKTDSVSYTGILWGILGGMFLGLAVFLYRWRFRKISNGPILQK